jgi:hypothetical protein
MQLSTNLTTENLNLIKVVMSNRYISNTSTASTNDFKVIFEISRFLNLYFYSFVSRFLTQESLNLLPHLLN